MDGSDDESSVIAIVAASVLVLSTYIELVGGPIREKRKQIPWLQTRGDFHQREAIDLWQNQYSAMNLLPYEEFYKLLEMIRPGLMVNGRKAENRTGARVITPEERLQMVLRYLAGARVLDLCANYGVSKRFVYTAVFKVCDLLIQHPLLRLKFPKTEDDMKTTAKEFEYRSYHGVLKGCLGAIDGWLVVIKAPPANECEGGNVRSYFSGHYQTYGVNVQSCVDVHSRFTALSMACPGKTNDAQAWVKWKLSQVIESFPFGYYVVGDNAYPCCDRLLTPFNVTEKGNCLYRDSYNFYLSQLRIRVEMAFGLLVAKFRIFQKPLEVSLPNVRRIVHASMIIRNFHITERLLKEGKALAKNDLASLGAFFGGSDGIQRPVYMPNGEKKRNAEGQVLYERIPADTTTELRFGLLNHNDVVMRSEAWHPWGHVDYDLVPIIEATNFGLRPHHGALRVSLVELLKAHHIIRPNNN